MILEIACFSAEDAILAQNLGADRIELCEDYSVGGITPSENSIKFAKENLTIDLFVMIRARGGDFIYSNEEFEEMKNQILLCKKINCNGVVFGILNEKNGIDKARNSELVQLAKPMRCTFHRAFDKTENIFNSLQDVIDCDFTCILSSGGSGNAADNLDNLKKLIELAGERITIMPGGGVRSNNIFEIIQSTNCKEIHSAAINKSTLRIDLEETKFIKEKIVDI